MRRWVIVSSLLMSFSTVATAAPALGEWTVVERPGSRLQIRRTGPTSLRLRVGERESGFAFLEDSTYVGVLEERLNVPDVRVVRVRLFRAAPLPDGALRVTMRNSWDSAAELVQTWKPMQGDTRLFEPFDPVLPAYGEYVSVDVRAEPIQVVQPEHPQIAREAGVEGTVVVQALVDIDGRVRDVKVTRSIPMLDQTALTCVRQWTFKPAMRSWDPVASWVEVKVPFLLR